MTPEEYPGGSFNHSQQRLLQACCINPKHYVLVKETYGTLIVRNILTNRLKFVKKVKLTSEP